MSHSIDTAIDLWGKAAESEMANFHLHGDDTAKVRRDVCLQTIRALEYEKRTGQAVCVCCMKPYTEGVTFLRKIKS